jgi:hypothetical protein
MRSTSSSFNNKFRQYGSEDANDATNNNDDDEVSVSSSVVTTSNNNYNSVYSSGVRRASSSSALLRGSTAPQQSVNRQQLPQQQVSSRGQQRMSLNLANSSNSNGSSSNSAGGAGRGARSDLGSSNSSPRQSFGSVRGAGLSTTPTASSSRNLSNSFNSESSKLTPPTSSSRLVGIFLAYVAAGEATKARDLIFISGCPRISSVEAAALLVRCADNPDLLAEPLATVQLLVDELGANVSAEDIAGRSVLQHLVTDQPLAHYLMSKGADPLGGLDVKDCALYQSLEYGLDWMAEFFIESGGEQKLFSASSGGIGASSGASVNNSTERRVRYLQCLLFGGRCARAKLFAETYNVPLGQDEEMIEILLEACRGNWENLKEPEDTIDYLNQLLISA